MTDTMNGPTRGVLNLRGACPLCGETVHRRVTRLAGSVQEVYNCRLDGAVRYTQGSGAALEVPRPDVVAGLDPRLFAPGPGAAAPLAGMA